MKRVFNFRAWLIVSAGVLALLALWVGLIAPRLSPSARATGQQASAADATTEWQHLVSILQYLGSDYPSAVTSMDQGELAEQRSLSKEALAIGARLGGPAAPFLERLAAIDGRVQRALDAAGVRDDTARLIDDLVATAGLSRAPQSPPDLGEGSRLFAQNCASCHGATGHADTAAAAALTPRPADFHDGERMGPMSPFKAFNTIRFGVMGTAMVPFPALDEQQRWALAFYLFTLRQPGCDHAPPRRSLEQLATSSDDALAKSEGQAQLPCLRRALPALDVASQLAAARSEIRGAVALYDRGDVAGAERAVLDAYLAGIEPVEPLLRARSPALVAEIEASFTATRVALQDRNPRARSEATELLALLDRAGQEPRKAAGGWSVFGFSLLVVVREGFEAAVIVAALLAVLKKRKQYDHARFVHLGWGSALALGGVLFFFGRRLLAGARSEALEGVLALIAVVMLLQAALWLNARATTRRAMGELRQKTSRALGRRSALGLFGIAFLAMFRESFETAVFLEALSIDAPSAVAWGGFAGVVLLLTLVVAVGRLGVRLPMTTLFRVSTGVLLATAVVLLGQGVHALQEIGWIPLSPLAFVRLDMLGIFPDRYTLIPQAALVLAVLLGARLRSSAAPPRAGVSGAASGGE